MGANMFDAQMLADIVAVTLQKNRSKV